MSAEATGWALAAATRYEHVNAAWAVVAAGATVVGLNGWWTGPEMEYGISLTAPKLLIGGAALLAGVDGRLPGLPRDDLEEVADSWFGTGASLPSGPIDENDPFVILFTSGTTGRPKAAVLRHRNNLHWIQSIGLRTAVSGRSPGRACEIAATPMFHISGLNSQAVASVAFGTKLVYLRPPDGGRPKNISASARNWGLRGGWSPPRVLEAARSALGPPPRPVEPALHRLRRVIRLP